MLQRKERHLAEALTGPVHRLDDHVLFLYGVQPLGRNQQYRKKLSLLGLRQLSTLNFPSSLQVCSIQPFQYEGHPASPHAYDEENIEAWRPKMVEKKTTFQFWNSVLRMEIIGLIFIRAHCEANFLLYVESLRSLVPWFFALDHHNYARWVPVHICDMDSLPPSILDEFQACGHWVQKTHNHFLAKPIDQAHEHNNALVKGSGGAVGLTKNPSSFRKWILAGPEQAQLLTEFEVQYSPEVREKYSHHEEGLSAQRTFKQQVLALVETIEDMGNPFLDVTTELLSLDKHYVIDKSVAHTICSIEALGKKKFTEYEKAVILDRTKSIFDPIEKNSLALFKRPS